MWLDNANSLPALLSPVPSLLPREILTFSYPWKFVKPPCPVNTRNVDEWTAQERLKASQAKLVLSIDELNAEVCLCLLKLIIY